MVWGLLQYGEYWRRERQTKWGKKEMHIENEGAKQQLVGLISHSCHGDGCVFHSV